jgi:hypothetical protein
MFAPYGPLQKRVQKLERPLHSRKIVAVTFAGEDEPEPPRDPNIRVIQITLDDPSEQGEAAGS